MKRFIKVIYTLIGLLIIVAICFGITTKKSFTENSTNLESYDHVDVSLEEKPDDPDYEMEGYDDIYFDNHIEGYDELVDKSDLIVVGKVIGERELYRQAIKTKFKIDKIIKDESIGQLADSIYIFEPCDFTLFSYSSTFGYNAMQDDTDYILFLKHLEVPDGYRYKNDESITFLPVSTYYSKYTLDDNENVEVIQLHDELTYKDIKDMGVLTEKKEIADTYNTIKKQINTEISHQ